MPQGRIIKALSGFYYIDDGTRLVPCRARGRFRKEGMSPLVGDIAVYSLDAQGAGRVDALLPRKNSFVRPAVANIDQMVVIAANVNPVTDPFLIDRVLAIAVHAGCDVLLCINKCDLDPGDRLNEIYSRSGFPVLRVSAQTGEGLDALRRSVAGRLNAFTGNSGVGKSSILNALQPELKLPVGEVSQKLGRGRHTTRHVEIFDLGGFSVADTPGFSSFDLEQMASLRATELPGAFPEFRPYLGQCRFRDCAHGKEPGCAVREAVERGEICASRYAGYLRLLEQALSVKDWELRETK